MISWEKRTAVRILTGAALILQCCTASQGADKDWTVSATSNYAGAVIAQFKPGSVKFNLEKFGLTMVTNGPDWTMDMYNEQNKKYMEVPYSHWQKRFSSIMGQKRGFLGDKQLETKKVGKSKKICGVAAEELYVHSVGPGAKPGHADLWVSKDIYPPKQMTILLKEILGIPADKGMPLLVDHYGPDNNKMTVWEAYKVSNATLPSSTFVLPKGMKKVEDEMELLIGDDMDMMGAEPESDKSSKAKPGDKLTPGRDLKKLLSPNASSKDKAAGLSDLKKMLAPKANQK